MTINGHVVKEYYVFLSSPRDVDAERKIVRTFFDEYNKLMTAAGWDTRFIVVDWENYLTIGIGRPQELITEQTLEKFRSSLVLVIGLIWQSFGSPTGKYESGTEEELRWVIKTRIRNKNWPEVKLYSRRVHAFTVQSDDPNCIRKALGQWEKVLNFRKELESHKLQLTFKEYESPNDFESVLRKDLLLWLTNTNQPWNRRSDRATSANIQVPALPKEDNYSLHLPSRVRDLENQLCHSFSLRDAIVVDVTLGEYDFVSKEDEKFYLYDKRLYNALGIWSACILTSTIRPHDVVGIGAGRSCYHTIENINFNDERLLNLGKVVSLTGKTGTNQWHPANEVSRIDLDADVLAFRFGIQVGVSANLVDSPIVCPSRKMLSLSDVTIAVVGIGVLTHGHSLCHFGKGGSLESVQSTIENIQVKADKYNRFPTKSDHRSFFCIADICNHLFLTTEGSNYWKEVNKKDRGYLEKQINELNNRFLCIKPIELQEICRRGIVICVAGGIYKTVALIHILRQTPPWITHLITDVHTAKSIVEYAN